MAQLKSTNITGNLAVTGNTLASKIIKLGGTNDDILMGDGSTTSKQALIDSLEAAMEGDTNTWRQIKVNGTSILGTGIDSGSLNLKAGTNVSISNSGGTVTISSSYTDTDTGATSIEVTGTGNAVTAASYNATTRKITLTKGSTFLTSHQSLAAYVKGPASSTDTAIALFNGTGGKTIKNSGLTVDTNGNLSGVGTLNCGGIKFVTESQPTILASQLGSAITVEGIETPVIYAPTTSGGTTFGVGTNGQVLKSNGTTVYWGTDNSGSGGLTSLPTRLAEYSTTGYDDANSATTQGWHYMTTNATNRPPFKQSANKDYRIMSTAYSSLWVQQIATDFRGNDMFLRRRENGTWKPWTPVVRFQDCTTDHKMQTITDNAIPRWDTGGTAMLQNSGITIDDSNNMTVPGYIATAENKMAIKFRTHTNYETGVAYGTSGNEALTIAMQNPVTAFQIVYGTKPSAYGTSTWQSVTPLFQTKDGKVIINRKITATADTSNLKLLDVNGDIGANGIFVNDITCSKILAPTASGGTTYGVGTNGQVLKSNGTTVYWASDSNNYAYVRQYQHGRKAAGATNCYPLLARYNLTNKNASYDTAYSRFHTDAYLNTTSGEISTRGYDLLDSNGVSKGSIALNTSNGITVACEGTNLVVEGSVNAYGGFYIQQPGGSRQNVATEDWVRQYVAENGGGGDNPGGGGGSTDPNHYLIVAFSHESRFNYSEDWSLEEEYFTNQYNEGEDNEESLYITPYSQYSENNKYVLYCYCPDETPQISINHHMELESEESINGQAFRVKITAPEEEMYQYWYVITVAVSGIVFTLNMTADQQYYED